MPLCFLQVPRIHRIWLSPPRKRRCSFCCGASFRPHCLAIFLPGFCSHAPGAPATKGLTLVPPPRLWFHCRVAHVVCGSRCAHSQRCGELLDSLSLSLSLSLPLCLSQTYSIPLCRLFTTAGSSWHRSILHCTTYLGAKYVRPAPLPSPPLSSLCAASSYLDPILCSPPQGPRALWC